MSGKRTPAVVCPGCGSCIWETRLSALLDEAGAVSAVYRVLAGRRGHHSVKGSGPSAEWVASYSRVPDAPERVRPTLRILGQRILRNLLDLGWVDDADVRRAAGLDAAVDAAVSRRAAEDASALARSYFGPPLPVSGPARIPVTRLEPKTMDLSRWGKGAK